MAPPCHSEYHSVLWTCACGLPTTVWKTTGTVYSILSILQYVPESSAHHGQHLGPRSRDAKCEMGGGGDDGGDERVVAVGVVVGRAH